MLLILHSKAAPMLAGVSAGRLTAQLTPTHHKLASEFWHGDAMHSPLRKAAPLVARHEGLRRTASVAAAYGAKPPPCVSRSWRHRLV